MSATARSIAATPAAGTTSSPTRRLVASAISPTTGGEATNPIRISQVTAVRPVPGSQAGQLIGAVHGGGNEGGDSETRRREAGDRAGNAGERQRQRPSPPR